MKSKVFREYNQVSGGNGSGDMNQSQMRHKLEVAQKAIQETSDQMDKKEFSSTVGGGAVKVTVFGNKTLSKIEILDESLIESYEMLIDLTIAGANEAFAQVDVYTDEAIEEITKGLPVSLLSSIDGEKN